MGNIPAYSLQADIGDCMRLEIKCDNIEQYNDIMQELLNRGFHVTSLSFGELDKPEDDQIGTMGNNQHWNS